MRIGLIIVGDEILSGRRADQHLPKVVAMLVQRGMSLSWAKIVGDDKELLEATYQNTLATDDIVFSTGGIGATPDDLTREAVAKALGVKTERHPEGVVLLEKTAKKRNLALTEQRYRLVEFPSGAELIPNPVNSIPGFTVGSHHFVPGFPEMAWPMIEWLLDNRYRHLHDNQYAERSVLVTGTHEGDLIPLLESVANSYPALKLFCLPSMKHELPVNEVGAKGNAAEVKAAMQELKEMLTSQGYQWERVN